MATDPSTGPDWTAVAQWGAYVGVFLTGLFAALFRRGREEVEGDKPTIVDTKIVTADSSAMTLLAGSVEANTTVMTENNNLQRQMLDEMRAIRADVSDYLSEQRKELEEDRLVRRLKEELREDREERP